MRYLLNGHSLVLNLVLCGGCGRCVEVCPHEVFSIIDRKAVVSYREGCMECGACRMNCPTQAIEVSSGVGCAASIIGSMRKKKSQKKCCASSTCG